MPPVDYGYMEGDQLGRPYDMKLLGRLAVFLRPHLKLVNLAVTLILLTTVLELLLPYITRLAIDDFMIRQSLELDLAKAPGGMAAEFLAQAGGSLLRDGDGAVFLREKDWRKVDPALSRELRKAGAVSGEPWYMAPPGPAVEEAALAHPGLFRRVDGQWLIPVSKLSSLPGGALASIREPDIRGLIFLAMIYLGVAGLAFFLGYVQTMLLERAGQEAMYSIRQDLYTHLLSRSLAFFNHNPVGKLVTRLTNDVQNINELFRSTLVALFQDLFLLAGIVVVLLILDVWLALACLALTPLIAALAWAFSRLAREAFRLLQGHLGRINSLLSETMDGLEVVKLFRAEERGREKFAKLNQGYLKAGMRQVWVFSVFMPLTGLLSSLTVALIIWYGGGLAVSERVSLGTLVAFISYMQMFFRPVRDLAEKYNVLQAAMASGERIFHLMDNREALPLEGPPPPAEAGPGRVTLENVTFGYDPEKPVVRGVGFSIPPGETWAVVGATGAGKTSLVSLIMRHYDPQEGRVEIDGIDLRRMSEEDLAKRVALVPQEVLLLAGTVAENVGMDRPGVDREAVQKALEVSGAMEFVAEMEQGMDTPLGEGGKRLSAGQRQILSLARALAGRPRVLILDEATSSVDPASERILQKALPRIMRGRTSLVVAHRLSTVRRADRILVMQRGRVVEEGVHEELAAAGGVYARLVHLEKLREKEGREPAGE